MTRRIPALWIALVGIGLAGVLLAACTSATPTPPPLPTATATPRSIPLPEVATSVPPASADRPLTVLLVRQVADASQDDADAIAARVVALTDLNVTFELVDSAAEVLPLLCGAEPVAAWLDGIAFAAVDARGCVDPALRVQQGRQTGFAADLLMAAEGAGDDSATPDPAQLAGQTLCRISSTDRISWLVAGLLLQAEGINPLYDLKTVDVEDFDALVEAIYDEECQAGVVPAGYLRAGLGDAVAALEGLRERVVVAAQSPEIPFSVLVYPPTVPLHVRIPLTDGFMQMAADSGDGALLARALGQDSLERVEDSDFEALRALLADTGLDFAALGE